MPDNDAIEGWIEKIERQLIPKLCADARFLDADKLTSRLTGSIERWRSGGQFSQIAENANELAAAVAILDLANEEVEMRYEPKLKLSNKSIDFCLNWPDGTRSWIDVKTIVPQWTDNDESWQRFEKLAKEFPDNSVLAVNRELAGAAISGQEIKTRWSFINRTVEIEQKVCSASIPLAYV